MPTHNAGSFSGNLTCEYELCHHFFTAPIYKSIARMYTVLRDTTEDPHVLEDL